MTVDEYLDGVPEPQRGTLMNLRALLREILPEAVETLSYGMPAFQVGGKTVAGYGAAKTHCSYYPHSGTILATVGPELDGYEWSPGALKFSIDHDLPRPLVEMLVARRLDQIGL